MYVTGEGRPRVGGKLIRVGALAVLSLGIVVTTMNPMNTTVEIR
jgi:hypothetical protein